MTRISFLRKWVARPAAIWLLGTLVVVAGCSTPPPDFKLNMVHLKVEERNGRLTEVQLQELADAMADLFGTPDQPFVPALEDVDTAGVLNQTYLDKAAGPVGSDEIGRERGLYRKHCVHCHGITGDGAGPTAAFLNPYPRDYRAGIFKFKTTSGTNPPTHADLKRTLVEGINGTSMPSFRLLDDDELEALVHYVRFLGIRGRVERNIISASVSELEPDDHLLDFALAQTEPAEFQEQLGYLVQEVNDEFERWQGLDKQIKAVPTPPAGWQAEWSPGGDPAWLVATRDGQVHSGVVVSRDDSRLVLETASVETLEIPLEQVAREGASWSAVSRDGQMHLGIKIREADGKVVYLDAGSGEEASLAMSEITDSGAPMALMVARGKRLFSGNIANCAQCHGSLALGDGQMTDYDEWTSAWTVKNTPPLDPKKNIVRLNEFLKIGALQPRNIHPRNLRMGIYRGGRRPVDLYLRMMNGIAGTPMPAASDKMSETDLWSLVAYVRSLPFEPISQPLENSGYQRERQ